MFSNDLYLKSIDNIFIEYKCQSSKDINRHLIKLKGVKGGLTFKLLELFVPVIYIVVVIYTFFYIAFKFLKALLISYSFRVEKFEVRNTNLFLFFCPQLYSKSKAARLYENSIYWVKGYNVNYSKFDISEKKIIDYKLYLSKVDSFIILYHSIKSLIGYVLKYHFLFNIINIWEFYEAKCALTRITQNNNIIFANQLDRWALLFDELPAQKKILLQHGMMPNNEPHKLMNIDIFYAMSDQTWKGAYENVFACKPELRIMDPTIKLTDMKSDKYKVLLITHILHFEIEKKIINSMQELDIELYVKKHPGVRNDKCYTDLLQDNRFTYITDTTFPKVDFLISYYSTLVYEYGAYNIPYYMYENDETVDVDYLKETIKQNVINSK